MGIEWSRRVDGYVMVSSCSVPEVEGWLYEVVMRGGALVCLLVMYDDVLVALWRCV